MSLDKTIRENLDGKYLTIHANHFREGIDYASQVKIPQIQLRGILGNEDIGLRVDFKCLDSLKHLKVLSFAGVLDNIVNFDSIYSLGCLEKIYIQQKQKFVIDISLFPKLIHLGSEYWKGLVNLGNAYSLKSLVLFKFSEANLDLLSKLGHLTVLHIYSSKIRTLDGIEGLSIKEFVLARNNSLEDIQAIKELAMLRELSIEKCKKIVNYDFLYGLNDLNVNIKQ